MIILNTIIFLFGLVVGSFLNCVIYRLEKKESFLRGRSYCPHCKHILKWYDLIPILSYLFLLGRCRYCATKISTQYPLVELATALIFLLIVRLAEGFPPLVSLPIGQELFLTVYLFLVACFLIIIFVYDLKHYIIPDKIVFPAIGVVLLYNLFLLFTGDYSLSRFFNMIYAGFFPALFFFTIFLISQGKWLGFGDVKLVFLMGLFLGYPQILVGLFLGVLFGGIIGLGLVIFAKKKLKSEIPFGPFLVTGTFLALFLGQNLINWYLNLFM